MAWERGDKKLRSFAGHPAIGEVRGYGLIGALELLPREGQAALAPTTILGIRDAKLAREEGVIVRGICDLLAVAPPLIITHGEINELFAGVEKAIERFW